MTEEGEPDEALIARYSRGDVAAFDSLYRRHELRVWRYLVRQIGDRALADETMQEVWCAVARDAHRYRPDAPFTSWLFTIARNRMIDLMRTRRSSVSLESGGLEAAVLAQLTTEPPTGPLSAVLAGEQMCAIARALEQLPREQRDAFLLHVEGELSVAEVAAITGTAFEATRSRLRYARARLRELLSEYA